MATIFKRFTPDLYEACYSVEEEEDGLRLDIYLSRFFLSFSRQQIKKKIISGEIRIKNRPHPHKPNSKVYLNEHVYICTPRGDLEDEMWNGEKLELPDPTLIADEDHLLVVNKPPFMTTHPTGKHLFYCATVYYEQIYNHTIHSIHRLDRETSGIQLLALNPKVANVYTEDFEYGRVKKAYFLIAHRKKDVVFPFSAKERMDHEDDFIPRTYVHCYPEDSKKGKHAHTDFELVLEKDDYYFALAYPHTGRQHQIRTHAAFHGFPLLGDKLYNGDPTVFMRFKDVIATEEDHKLMQIPRHALHSVGIKLKDRDVYIADLPHDFKNWIKDNLEVDIESLEKTIKEKVRLRLTGKN